MGGMALDEDSASSILEQSATRQREPRRKPEDEESMGEGMEAAAGPGTSLFGVNPIGEEAAQVRARRASEMRLCCSFPATALSMLP
jgi:hypothetical protein